MLRWGIIGTGGIARAFAADLELTGSGTVAAVGSRSLEKARAFGFGRAHGSYEALVADPDVDVVYVATPHPMHHANARLALEAGKPVLVEKAFTMNADEAKDLVSLARERELFLMEAMWTRFLPHMAEIRRLIADGALGEIVTVLADHGQWFPQDPAFRLFAPELGGGALLDLGVYPVSFASMVLGTPERIVTLSTPAFTGVDGRPGRDHLHVVGRLPHDGRDRRHRGADRDRAPLVRPGGVHAHAARRGAHEVRDEPRGARAALGGRRGGPLHRAGPAREPAAGPRRDRGGHGDDGRGARGRHRVTIHTL
jgi:predicted dehydrogenase